jgi:hypothetical protein
MDKTCEIAFYLDEAGPYLVRPNPGQKWAEETKPWKIPSFWKTRGKVVIFGALKANPGKVYHHIDNGKGCKVMLKFIQRLANLYKHMRKIYLIWDNARAHDAKHLTGWIKRWKAKGRVNFKVLPLPTYSPWLNPIEPVFGGLYRKVIAGSNFRWPSNMADAIHKYFRYRNCQVDNKHRTLN